MKRFYLSYMIALWLGGWHPTGHAIPSGSAALLGNTLKSDYVALYPLTSFEGGYQDVSGNQIDAKCITFDCPEVTNPVSTASSFYCAKFSPDSGAVGAELGSFVSKAGVTVHGFVSFAENSNGGTILSLGRGNQSEVLRFSVGKGRDSKFRTKFVLKLGRKKFSVGGVNKRDLNSWSFLSAKYDRQGRTIAVYENGSLIAQRTIRSRKAFKATELRVGSSLVRGNGGEFLLSHVGLATSSLSQRILLETQNELLLSVGLDPQPDPTPEVSPQPTPPPSSGAFRSSITQHGITWTFDKAYETGQFVNGDWWANIGTGSIRIVDINPKTQTVNGRDVHGSMINPGVVGCPNGYDTELYHQYEPYTRALNVAWGISSSNPLVIDYPASLISSKSFVTPDPEVPWISLDTAAVLTILESPPPQGAFRPPYAGTDKTIRHWLGQLDLSGLDSLVPVGSPPTLSYLNRATERVWLDHCTHWINRYLHPKNNMPDYYREFTTLLGQVGLSLNLNYTQAEKLPLAVNAAQIGIDWQRNVDMGANRGGEPNGHENGRKFPIMLSGYLLQDSSKLNIYQTYPTVYQGPSSTNNVFNFSEDGQTFYIQQTAPGEYNWNIGGYNATHVGMAEWGNFGPASANQSWSGYRTCCSANGWVGQELAMRIMGLQDEWGVPAFFDYMDRYMDTMPNTWERSWDPWTGLMRDHYRSFFP